MMRIPYTHVDAFADRPFTGNQAAVMPLEKWLSDEVLQAIGAENNFAETAFIVPDETGDADYELRWFTPTTEIRLCGHATLASGYVLLDRDGGERVTFRTRKAGLLEVRQGSSGCEVSLPAIATTPFAWPEASAPLGAHDAEVFRNADGYTIFLLENEAAVRALIPDFRALETLSEDLYVCTAPGERTDIVSRAFAPGHGIDEDPVTGGAPCGTCSVLGRAPWSRQIHRVSGEHAGRQSDLPAGRRPSLAWRAVRHRGRGDVLPFRVKFQNIGQLDRAWVAVPHRPNGRAGRS